jgi:hypothetical protein
MLTAAAPAAANASVRNLISLFMIVVPLSDDYLTAARLGLRSRKRGYFVAVQHIWRLEASERCT